MVYINYIENKQPTSNIMKINVTYVAVAIVSVALVVLAVAPYPNETPRTDYTTSVVEG